MSIHSADIKLRNRLTDRQTHAQTHITTCNHARQPDCNMPPAINIRRSHSLKGRGILLYQHRDWSLSPS